MNEIFAAAWPRNFSLARTSALTEKEPITTRSNRAWTAAPGR